MGTMPATYGARKRQNNVFPTQPTVDLVLQGTGQDIIYYVGLSWDNPLAVLIQEIPFL